MNKYLAKALEVAKTSKCRYKHGAVVVSNGTIVASKTNKKISAPLDNQWRRAHIHAEAAAVKAAGKYAAGSIVYVARIAADGSPTNSKPCKKCEGFMDRYKIAQVVWTL
jgi:pyrimidine deaminase RibD-like protein